MCDDGYYSTLVRMWWYAHLITYVRLFSVGLDMLLREARVTNERETFIEGILSI